MPNDINKLRRIMRTSNYLKKTRPAIFRGAQLDASNALKYAWWFESFRNELRTGVFRFSYFKKEGGIREARGTLNMAHIPEDKRPKSNDQRPKANGSFAYFDLDRNAWRSFCLDNFIGFVMKAE